MKLKERTRQSNGTLAMDKDAFDALVDYGLAWLKSSYTVNNGEVYPPVYVVRGGEYYLDDIDGRKITLRRC